MKFITHFWVIASLAQNLFADVPHIFKNFCFQCHSATQAEGDLDLEAFLAKKQEAGNSRTLEEILTRLKVHDMPPKESEKQPSDAERADMLAWANAQLNTLAHASVDDPGMVVMPRLTRNEYRNVIRDLSGGVVAKGGEYLPNEGGAGEGFANVGAAQGMGAAHFEKYLEAAKGALKYLRVSSYDGFVWRELPREAVDEKRFAIIEATDDIIDWYGRQQQKWGAQHRDALVAQAMLDEVTTFLSDLFCNDAPLTNLLDADYTFANEELAKHYGIAWGDNQTAGQADRERASVSPSDFLKVPLSQQRGGLATMALFLTKTSQPLRTSPVQRGNWVIETLIGQRIPPPPPNVPKLSDDEKSSEGLNIQQQLAQHRSDANCAGCHAKLDPPGVALENFDPIGRWRDAERDGSPITNTDTLSDGTKLEGVAGLKRFLRSREAEFFTNFNRKLLGYALGRAVLPGDRRLLDEMQATASTSDYRFSSLVDLIITSPQFTNRRTMP